MIRSAERIHTCSNTPILVPPGRSMNVNLASPAFKANPYPFYKRLRDTAPVCPVSLPDGRTAWLVTRYEDVLGVLKDRRFVKDRENVLWPEQAMKKPWFPRSFKAVERTMIEMDEPDHGRLRGLVHEAFTPRMVEAMRPRVESITNELLDAAQTRGEMDVIKDYALPLPTRIIAEMLGVPPEDRHKFHRWSNAFISAISSKWGNLKAIPSIRAFMKYTRQLIRDRRCAPADDEQDGDHLTENELVSMIILLLFAGHETTVNLIGNGTLALLRHPDQMEKLRGDPTLVRTAVEEFLRYDGPSETASERYASEELTISGVTIPCGALVYAVLASANRDERQFEVPDTLNIARDNNRHLAFGQGPHYCLGAPLARLEGQVAFRTLVHRMPELRLARPVESLRWKAGLILRGLQVLPVAFDERQRAVA
jgi:cytochrome P450